MSEDGTTRVFLVRHGEVDASWRGRIYGDLEVPLSERGREEAARAAAVLASVPLAAVLCSDLERARYGAERIAHGRPFEPLERPRLREIRRGCWRGKSFDEVDRESNGAWTKWMNDPARRAPAEGESLTQLHARVLPEFQRAADENPGRNVAVVAHSWVVRTALCLGLGLDLRQAPRLGAPTGSIHLLEHRTNTGWRCAGTQLDRVPEAAPWRAGPRPK